MTEATLTKPQSTSLTWDLESIFAGGASGDEFVAFRAELKDSLAKVSEELESLPQKLGGDADGAWEKFILDSGRLLASLEHARSYAGCLTSEDVADDTAAQASGEIDEQVGKYFEMMIGFEALCGKQADSQWQTLLAREKLAPLSFPLDEMRIRARLKMDPEFEALAEELATNGYHSWNRLYDKMAGDLSVQWSDNGNSEEISLGQLAGKLYHADRAVRKEAYEKLSEAWKSRQALAGMALNYQAGFRLSLYKRRGWKSAVDEPLRINRMKRETLDAMWSAVNESVPKLKGYIEAKKKILGINKFNWYDTGAPVGESSSSFSWDQAWDFVDDNIGNFSAEMRDFVRLARDKRWVEGEDRPGKAGGGFCTGYPLAGESRIFMTFSDTYGDLSTLAHELGHAYHSHTLRDFPYLTTQYPMNLAETASTFNELLIIDAALKQSTSRDEKLMLLDQKMQSALTFFCNIQARYLFDSRFYEKRPSGSLTPAELSELMVQCQRDSFGGLLDADGFDPYFWASKLHFYITDYPFYNFPYTFGYLFATGVYAHALKQGASFADGYRALLQDTGRMATEDIAQKHLDVDLTQPNFWRMAVESALEGMDEFVKLAND